MDIKISVIIPVYNTDIEYLDICLDSVMNNTMKEIEILIIDDGSENKVIEKLKYYEKTDKRVRLFLLEHGGVSNARNTGIKNAHGEFIMFIDSDDHVDNKYFEIYYKTIKEYNADVVMGDLIARSECNEQTNKFDSDNINVREDINKISLQKQMFYPGYDGFHYTESPVNKIYKKEFLKHFNILFYDGLTIGEDAVFNFNIYQNANKIVVFDYKGYEYRCNSNSIMNRYDKNRKIRYEALFACCNNIIKQYNLETEFSGDVEYFIIGTVIKKYMPMLYFHPENGMSGTERKKALKQLVNEPLYSEAAKKCCLKNFNIRLRVFI